MPLFRNIPISQGRIGIWQLSETLSDFLPDFSEKELSDQTFTQYSNEKRKIEWLATRLLLREMIGPDFSISYSPSGKPQLNHKIFRNISITHSRDFVAVIVHESSHVGIDIEATNRDFQRVEKRFLSDEELNLANENIQLKCFFWCAKEAVFKLVEEEGIEFKEQIIVRPNPELQNQFLANFITPEKNVSYLLNYDYFSENCLVWIVA